MKPHGWLTRARSSVFGKAVRPPTNRRSDNWVPLRFETLETRRLLSVVGSSSSSVLDAYVQNPLVFEPNLGQTAAPIQYLARGQGYGLYLAADGAVLSLQKSAGTSSPTATPAALPAPAVLTMQLVGANPAAASTGLDKLASTTNYLGASRATSITGIPNYGQVEYQNVYAGVNVIYYGNQQQLEFNFVVAPGADPQTIALRFQGADSMALNGAGNLVLHTAGGNVVEHAPVVYQVIHGAKQTVAAAFVMRGANQVGFQLGTYDRSQPLVIDPVVVYSTYLGGSNVDDGMAIAVDRNGYSYVTGYTESLNFPATSSAYQGSFDPGSESDGTKLFGNTTFVSKFDPSGQLLASTYLGGNGYASGNTYYQVNNRGTGIVVDKSGNVYLTGWAESGDAGSGTNYLPFPTTLTPFPVPTDHLDYATYAMELTSALDQPIYSTYLGGNGGVGIAVDAAGDAYVTFATFTASATNNFTTPPTNNYQDVSVVRLNPQGGIVYDRNFGPDTIPPAAATDDIGSPPGGIAVDAAGDAYIVGASDTLGLASANRGGYNVYVLKLDPQGAQSTPTMSAAAAMITAVPLPLTRPAMPT